MHQFGLVITDWHMPVCSGLELVARIRAVNQIVPIVMVTIVDTKPMILEALRVGVSDYLCKPFDRCTLQAKLDKYVPLTIE
jgi:two-component system chemotaxis response regulator CheY